MDQNGRECDSFHQCGVLNAGLLTGQSKITGRQGAKMAPLWPAYASHTYHRPSTIGYWDRVQRLGSALGNGVMDLAEKSAPGLLMNMASIYILSSIPLEHLSAKMVAVLS